MWMLMGITWTGNIIGRPFGIFCTSDVSLLRPKGSHKYLSDPFFCHPKSTDHQAGLPVPFDTERDSEDWIRTMHSISQPGSINRMVD